MVPDCLASLIMMSLLKGQMCQLTCNFVYTIRKSYIVIISVLVSVFILEKGLKLYRNKAVYKVYIKITRVDLCRDGSAKSNKTRVAGTRNICRLKVHPYSFS